MANKRNRFIAILRIAAAGVLAVQLLLLARGILAGTRFQGTPGRQIAVGFVTTLVISAAIAILLNGWRPKSRTIQVLVVGVALALTVRFHLATYLHRHKSAEPRLAWLESPKLVTFLRNLAAAQEQYRLRYGRYSNSMDSLREWTEQPAGSVVKLFARQDMSWSAQASLAGSTCTIWVRDSALRVEPGQPEGSPACGIVEHRDTREIVTSVLVPPASRVTTFKDADISGTWREHRSDARRTSVAEDAAGTPGYRWDARVGGPLRAPVSIAGNQVFVGAHGNGELAALTLDSGKLGFRLRAPNWIHHEPAVSNDLVIVGFGNNEWVKNHSMGTAPSGVVAYDRRTGFERWRFNTAGSVMGVPVIADSVVAVSTGEFEAVGMRLRDGVQLWRTSVTNHTPMGNPLLIDSLMIFGVEQVSVCAIDTRNGALAYCTRLVDGCPARRPEGLSIAYCWGAGHASPARAGDLALQVFESDTTIVRPIERMMHIVKKVIGFPPPLGREPDVGEQILVAFDWRDGRVRWRTSLGKGSLFPPGHIAGTPIVVDTVAFIPAANNGHVVAVNTRTGRVIWSAPVRSSRGSVNVIRGSVFAATNDTTFVVLDAANGRVTCRQRLPARADRAGLTIAGETGILTLGNGTVMARPLSDWLACHG